MALAGLVTPLGVALVVRICPIKSTFWDCIDGSINLGASYARSCRVALRLRSSSQSLPAPS
jgi:hypothetical protein